MKRRGQADEVRYKIKFKKGKGWAAEAFLNNLKGKRVKRRGRADRRMLAANLSHKQLKRLQKSRMIESIELDQPRYLMAESVPYGVTMVQASMEISNMAEPRKVCIIDTGYDATHEDLPGTASDRINGYSQFPEEQWSEDGHGHGTHVAGTIAALGGNDTGVIGVHSGSKLQLHIIKIFDNQGNWVTFSSDLIDALDRCVAAGSHIVSMSLGGSFEDDTERQSFQSAADDGVILVAAAGNNGSASYSYPASYDSVISVAAIDSNESRASFSQYNDQVELAAPGVAVESALPGNTYASWSGTSMATPHVAAVAAVLWGLNPNCDAAQIRGHLTASAKNLGVPGRDNYYGYGLVQLQDADASILQNDCEVPPLPPKLALQNGQPLSDLAGGKEEQFAFKIVPPEGSSDLLLTIGGGSGDADIYLSAGSEPSLTAYDCRPWLPGNDEHCSVTGALVGTYHGMVHGYSAYSGVTLTATWNEPSEPPANEPPQAIIYTSTLKGPAPLEVEFDSSGSSDDKGIESRHWVLGDGSNTSGPVSVSHNYSEPGVYRVVLTVTDEEGEKDQAEATIVVTENVAPVAQVTILTETPQAGEPVSFDGSASSDEDGAITEWSWFFGDGMIGSGQSVDHTYQNVGSYNVELTVSDTSGAEGTANATVDVQAAPPPPETTITASWSLNSRGTRMGVYWSGATTSLVEIYRNGDLIKRTRNDGRWNDRNPISNAVYLVCNDQTNECSQP